MPASQWTGYTRTAKSWRGRAATGPRLADWSLTYEPLTRAVGGDVTAREDQSGYVASILSRRAKLPEPMWDLDNTTLGVLAAAG